MRKCRYRSAVFRFIPMAATSVLLLGCTHSVPTDRNSPDYKAARAYAYSLAPSAPSPGVLHLSKSDSANYCRKNVVPVLVEERKLDRATSQAGCLDALIQYRADYKRNPKQFG